MDAGGIKRAGVSAATGSIKGRTFKDKCASIDTKDSFQHAASNEQNLIDLGKVAKMLSERTNSKNMKQLWMNDLHPNLQSNQYNEPKINTGPDGTIYGIDGSTGFAMDKDTGEIKWKKEIGMTRFTAPAVSPDGTLYFSVDNQTESATVKSIDGKTGKEKWSSTINEFVCSSPMVDVDGNVYVTTQGNRDKNPKKKLSGGLVKFKKRNGKVKWRNSIGDGITESAVMGKKSRVFVSSLNEQFLAVDKDNGKTLWQMNLPAKGSYKNSSKPAIGTDGTVFIQVSNTKLFALDPGTGKEKWTFNCDTVQDYDGITVDEDNNVFIGGRDGVLHALDGETGKELWQAKFEGRHHALTTVIPGGMICVAGKGSNLVRILDIKTGIEKGHTETGGSVYTAPRVTDDGTIIVSTGKGSVHAFKYDERSLLEQVKEDAEASEKTDSKIEIKEKQVIIGGVELPRKQGNS